MFVTVLLRYSYCVHHCIPFAIMAFLFPDFADGVPLISWPAVPDVQINVNQGSPFNLRWNYRMEENVTFLSSMITQKVQQSSFDLASRHNGDDTYSILKTDFPFSIFGKNNVTLTVHSARLGDRVTYCCKVQWRYQNGKKEITKVDEKCSEVFVYVVPKITNHQPQLDCKEGESINLKCDVTGIPKPHAHWLNDDTHELIENSTDIVLNITGKKSEGKYCCDAKNEFGKEKACTSVNVVEYKPVKTRLLIEKSLKNVYIKCTADAFPPPHYLINVNGTAYNSSDGLKTIKPPAPEKGKIVVSCIPYNEYGPGLSKQLYCSSYVSKPAPPEFIAPVQMEYNLTLSGVTLYCNATGVPTPTITWSGEDPGKILGIGKYFKVPYRCGPKTMKFFCHAKNMMGMISSQEIHVRTNSFLGANCSTVDKGFDKTATTIHEKENIVVVGVTIAVVVPAILIVLVAILRKKASKGIHSERTNLKILGVAEDDNVLPAVIPHSSSTSTTLSLLTNAEVKECMDDSPYQEPIDSRSVVTGLQVELQPFPRNNATHPLEDDYATVEECRPSRIRPKARDFYMPVTARNNPHLEEEDPLYEKVVFRDKDLTPDAI